MYVIIYIDKDSLGVSVSVKYIAEAVVKKVASEAKILYGKEKRGWVGDIPKFKYDISKIKRYGWSPRINSKQSISKAIDEIYNSIK